MKVWNLQYKTLDHWRGIAALWVMTFHGFGTTLHQPLHLSVEAIKFIAASGWLGVHLFFVISGYCIAASGYKLIQQDQDFIDFIKSRLLRLMPTYWAAFALTIVVNLISSPFNKTSFFDAFPNSVLSWLGNLLLIQPYLNSPFFVVVYWSLAVEIGFYLIVTLLLIIKKYINLKIAIITALLLNIISIFIPNISYLGMLFYWSEFFCGVLVFGALFFDNCRDFYKRNLCLGLIIISGILSYFTSMSYGSNSQLFFSAAFSILIFLLYRFDHVIASIRLLDGLRKIGLISYSLYLLHVPFQGRIINLGLKYISIDSPLLFLLQVMGWAVAISVSLMFYNLVENPLNRWRSHILKKS